MKLQKVIRGLAILAVLAIGYYWYYNLDNTAVIPEQTGGDIMLTSTACEEQGGHVVFGIGPAPECEPSETVLGRVQETTSGAMAIEGALCCK